VHFLVNVLLECLAFLGWQVLPAALPVLASEQESIKFSTGILGELVLAVWNGLAFLWWAQLDNLGDLWEVDKVGVILKKMTETLYHYREYFH
jgi:hypothetical protein